MKKSDLITQLSPYPDDMEVKVVCDRFVRPVTAVSEIVDMDTNIVSIEIIAEDKPDMNEMLRNSGHPYIVGKRRGDAPPLPVISPERLAEAKRTVSKYMR